MSVLMGCRNVTLANVVWVSRLATLPGRVFEKQITGRTEVASRV